MLEESEKEDLTLIMQITDLQKIICVILYLKYYIPRFTENYMCDFLLEILHSKNIRTRTSLLRDF